MKNDKQHYLARLELNWADEADFVYFEIYDSSEKKNLIKRLKDIGDDYVSIYFGTNEGSEFTGNEILDSIEWKKIPDDSTRKFLEDNVCVHYNSIEEILSTIDEDDDEYEDDDNEDEDEE